MLSSLRLYARVERTTALRVKSVSRRYCVKTKSEPFELPSSFLNQYKNQKPPFGFNGLGEVVYRRTYSRVKDSGGNEQWWETVQRVVNGTYNMQRRWIEGHSLGWNADRAQKSAQEMYRRIFYMKFLPPGRGLWAMGSPLTEQKGLYAALNNCAFVSTESMAEDPSGPFCFLMDASMLGVGVGFDTRGESSIHIKEPASDVTETYVIPDTREGWVESVRRLLKAFMEGGAMPIFDYSKIRPKGSPIIGFGGTASGADPLRQLHKDIEAGLRQASGKPITITTIVDIMNFIGRCVVAGNVRRTAEIAFGPPSPEYIDLKNYDKNPHRMPYAWTSNNSIYAEHGMDYGPIADRVQQNGEPGFAWLHNMRAYGRMKDPPNWKDHRARGGNPCLEQTLESYELCCLVETFPNNHVDCEDYQKTLKYAYLYAKTVTLGKTHWPNANRVMLRNRRIGCSMSGIAQFVAERGINTLKQWCEEGYQAIQKYDKDYSSWLAIPNSIKTTSIKPSGTVSLLAGATPGMHWPLSRFYIRRIRLASDSTLIEPLRKAGYPIEACKQDPTQTTIVEFPVDCCEGANVNLRRLADVPMWEQLEMASFLQNHWADNQVSCTISFDPQNEGHQLQRTLEYFQYKLKGVSFLPLSKDSYPQMPYEEITQEEYETRKSNIRQFNLDAIDSTPDPEKFCDNEKCNL